MTVPVVLFISTLEPSQPATWVLNTMGVQYKSVVSWDATLVDVGFVSSNGGTYTVGLACSAIKITAGAPNTNANQFIAGAKIYNAADGSEYRNTGSTSSPVWSPITPASVPLAKAEIFVGNSSNIAAAVNMSGDASIDDTGAVNLSDSVKVYTTKVSLTAAQIKAVVTGPTPFTLIVAPGSNKIISVQSSFIRLNFGTVAFDFDDGLSIGTGATSSDGGGIQSISLNNTSSEIVGNRPGSGPITSNAALVLNTGLATTVTQGDSTVDIYITYKVTTL